MSQLQETTIITIKLFSQKKYLTYERLHLSLCVMKQSDRHFQVTLLKKLLWNYTQ